MTSLMERCLISILTLLVLDSLDLKVDHAIIGL